MSGFHFGNMEKFRRLRIPAMLLATLVVGVVLGICFERTVGMSLSDRLARRIGTANAQVVSCARSGSELTVTVALQNAPHQQKTDSEASYPTFQLGMDLANYGTVIGAVKEELTSDPLERGIDHVAIVCQYQGKTMTTLMGDRESQNAGTFDKNGKPISPPPFSNFEAQNPDGSTDAFFMAESNSSAPAP